MRTRFSYRFRFAGGASTDRFLLEQVERAGKNLWESLEIEVEERRFVHDWDTGGTDMEDWSLNLQALIADGLVAEREGEGEYALTHDGRSQLHSLRAAERTEKRLKVAVVSLVVATTALIVSVALQVIGLLTR